MKLIPAREASHEFSVRNSRFIATAAPAFSVDAAKEFISRIRRRYPDATHHVPVYVIGHGSNVLAHSSDDGEPSGTAGRPVLAVVQGSGFGDIAVVVTRYFGGTKLGTGGLVRAYSSAVKELLARLPRAEKLTTVLARVRLPYRFVQPVRKAVLESRAWIVHEAFAEEVEFELRVPDGDYNDLLARIRNLSNGEWIPETVSIDKDSIVELSKTKRR